MCGITGIVNYKTRTVDESSLLNMRDSLKHRGPDDNGFYITSTAGEKALKILDFLKYAQCI